MNRYIDQLMSRMTLEEKLGQLNLPVTGNIVTGAARESDVAEDIRQGRVGGRREGIRGRLAGIL